MAAKSKAVSKVEAAPLPDFVGSVGENPWDNLTDIDRFDSGAVLYRKLALVGIPFIITKVVYRTGAYKRAGELLADDYVSIEATVEPSYDMDRVAARRAKLLADVSSEVLSAAGGEFAGPGEQVVFNDRSTGLYRQITAYLHSKGLIAVSADGDKSPNTLAGSLGDSLYDQSRDEWARGSEAATSGIPVKVQAANGLRVSVYRMSDNAAEDSMTFYF